MFHFRMTFLIFLSNLFGYLKEKKKKKKQLDDEDEIDVGVAPVEAGIDRFQMLAMMEDDDVGQKESEDEDAVSLSLFVSPFLSVLIK